MALKDWKQTEKSWIWENQVTKQVIGLFYSPYGWCVNDYTEHLPKQITKWFDNKAKATQALQKYMRNH